MGLHKDVNMSENHVLVDYRDIKDCLNILVSTAIIKLLSYVFMKNKTSVRFFFLYDFIHFLKDCRDLWWTMKPFLQRLFQYTPELGFILIPTL